MSNGSNIGLGLADILAKTSSTAPNMLQRAGAVLQGKPDPMTEFQNQDFARRVTLAQLLRQEKQAKREDIKFEREGEGNKELQEAIGIFITDPIGAASKIASAAVKAGKTELGFKALEFGDKIRKDKALQAEAASLQTRLEAARTPEERREILLKSTTLTGAKDLLELVGKAMDVESKARQLEAPQGAPNRLALDAIRKGETLPNLTMEQTQRLAGLTQEPINQQAAKAIAQGKSLPGFTAEETKRMAGAAAERQPDQLDRIASELSARRSGRPPGSAIPVFKGLSDEELVKKLLGQENLAAALMQLLLPGANPPAPKTAPKTMRIRHKKTGQEFEGLEGPVPEGYEKVK